MLTEDHCLLDVCEMTTLKFIDNKNKDTYEHKIESTGVIEELCLLHLVYGCDSRKMKPPGAGLLFP